MNPLLLYFALWVILLTGISVYRQAYRVQQFTT